MITADESLQRLIEGNKRFLTKNSQLNAASSQTRREELVGGQAPFAIILGCSDSRVPTEVIFDQDFGDLFVVRVAGNIVEPSQLGSIEFAAANFGSSLIVVLGHTQCGAVKATIGALNSGEGSGSASIDSLVESIKPAISSLTENYSNDNALLSDAIKANVRHSASKLSRESKVLSELIKSDKLKIVCAEYSLETAKVEFFDLDDA